MTKQAERLAIRQIDTMRDELRKRAAYSTLKLVRMQWSAGAEPKEWGVSDTLVLAVENGGHQSAATGSAFRDACFAVSGGADCFSFDWPVERSSRVVTADIFWGQETDKPMFREYCTLAGELLAVLKKLGVINIQKPITSFCESRFEFILAAEIWRCVETKLLETDVKYGLWAKWANGGNYYVPDVETIDRDSDKFFDGKNPCFQIPVKELEENVFWVTDLMIECLLNDKASKRGKPKRSTTSGQVRATLIGALSLHHKYKDGVLNWEPIGNNKLAQRAEVSNSSANRFFNKTFDGPNGKEGYSRYRIACQNDRLFGYLKVLNGDLSKDSHYGRRPPCEGDRDNE